MSSSCTSPVVELGGSTAHVLKPTLMGSDIKLLMQPVQAPDCVLQSGYSSREKENFGKCVQELDCKRRDHYGCFNGNGDQFASCKRRHCQ